MKKSELADVLEVLSQIEPDRRKALLDEAANGDPSLEARIEALLEPATSMAKSIQELEASHPDLSERLQVQLDEWYRVRSMHARLEGATGFGWVGEAAPNDRLPENIGGYRITEVLGRGGMGVVYRAEQRNPARAVALKVIHPDVMNPRQKRRFEFEVTALGRLRHPGIAQIFEAGAAETDIGIQPYFAMELVEGASLLEYARGADLTVGGKLRLIASIADAVEHAHQKGIVHRDLKPGNVLVDSRGQPKVLDFGIAKSTDSDLQTTTVGTEVGQLVGTLAYMSPEQASGDVDQIDTRSDVYALGVILYQLLTGNLPYELEGKRIHEAASVIRDVNPTPLSSHLKTLRGDVETITTKALEKERSRRYQSAVALANDIRRHLDHEPILARPPSRPYQLRKFARRHRTLVAGLTIVFASLAIGLAGTLTFLHQSEDNFRKFRGLADPVLLDELKRESDQLWPRREETIPLMRSWLERMNEILGRVEENMEGLKELEQTGIQNADGTFSFSTVDDELRHSRLTAYLRAVRDIADPQRGLVADVEARLEIATMIEERTVDDYEEEWFDAIGNIFGSEPYGDLELEPQVGLVPLERCPRSGLWEFWVWESGDRPEREDGSWSIQPETGIVLVLVPGGRFEMGASTNPNHPQFDPRATDNETPLIKVPLEPFFLSKYEMTQGQFFRLMGWNRSVVKRNDSKHNDPALDILPVENISWAEANDAAHRLGFRLPTEAQWEFACRAGTTSPFYCDPESLMEHENLSNQSDSVDPIGGDGWIMSSPVGYYQANPFGFHDMQGNVVEYCLDPWGSLTIPPREGDGFRNSGALYRSVRGGSFMWGESEARAAGRGSISPGAFERDYGLRPAAAIVPP